MKREDFNHVYLVLLRQKYNFGSVESDVVLKINKTSFVSTASRKLVEYEILAERLQIISLNNVSHAVMKFVFRRRSEYHVANTFLQVR